MLVMVVVSAASIRFSVIARPRVLTWLRRGSPPPSWGWAPAWRCPGADGGAVPCAAVRWWSRPVPFGHDAHRPGRVALHHRASGARRRPGGRRPAEDPVPGVAVRRALGLHDSVLPRPRPPLRRREAGSG